MPRQSSIISSLNRYCKKTHTKMKLNEGGICAALSALYIEYVLSGKKVEFLALMRRIKHLVDTSGDQVNSEVSRFIQKLEFAFRPGRYNQSLNQADIDRHLKVNNKKVNKLFQLSAVTDLTQWFDIFEQLRVEGRTIQLGSHNHSMAIDIENGKYVLYDPNFDEEDGQDEQGRSFEIKVFENAYDLLREIRQCFAYQERVFGLGLMIVGAHDCQDPVPDKMQLLAAIFKQDEALGKSLLKIITLYTYYLRW